MIQRSIRNASAPIPMIQRIGATIKIEHRVNMVGSATRVRSNCDEPSTNNPAVIPLAQATIESTNAITPKRLNSNISQILVFATVLVFLLVRATVE